MKNRANEKNNEYYIIIDRIIYIYNKIINKKFCGIELEWVARNNEINSKKMNIMQNDSNHKK